MMEDFDRLVFYRELDGKRAKGRAGVLSELK